MQFIICIIFALVLCSSTSFLSGYLFGTAKREIKAEKSDCTRRVKSKKRKKDDARNQLIMQAELYNFMNYNGEEQKDPEEVVNQWQQKK